jgi:colicin import membrane protein
MHIDDLYDEAKGILDGAGVQSDADAEMVAKLLDMARQAKKAADEQRTVEKKPHDDAAKAVQSAWKPLLDKCDLVADTCKKALAPFLTAKEAAQRAEAARIAAEAEEARAAALAARQAAAPDDLTAREEAERLDTVAGEAEKQAARAERAKAHATGGSRAVGLRDAYSAEVTDYALFSKWAWANRRADYEEWLSELASQEAKRGPVTIPGIIIHTERKAA